MAWLGFLTLITIYWCIYLTATTAQPDWALLSGWLLPILGLTLHFQEGTEVNGLMVLLCLLLFCGCRHGLAEVRMWNIKQRKKHPFLFGTLYAIVFLLMLYCFIQAQLQGYLLNIQGWGSETMPLLRQILTILPLLWLNYRYTALLYTAIDRLKRKKKELVLLSCRFFMANARGTEKLGRQGYYLEGIQNGITYHFALTKRTFQMLKKEKNLRLQIETGLFGGIYVTALESEEWLRRVRRFDRRWMKIGLMGFLCVIVSGVWLFWIR